MIKEYETKLDRFKKEVNERFNQQDKKIDKIINLVEKISKSQ